MYNNGFPVNYNYYQPVATPQMQMQPQVVQQPQAIQQSQPQPQSQENVSGNGFIWVQGEAGARGFLVAPGNSVILMDSEKPVFYIKSADQSGVPKKLRIFDYTERTNEEDEFKAPVANTVADDDLRSKIDLMGLKLAVLENQMLELTNPKPKEETRNESALSNVRKQ